MLVIGCCKKITCVHFNMEEAEESLCKTVEDSVCCGVIGVFVAAGAFLISAWYILAHFTFE